MSDERILGMGGSTATHDRGSDWWYMCEKCRARLRQSQRAHHDRYEHIERPHEEAMTTGEVAKVLKCSAWTVRYKINTGKLRAFTQGAGRGSRTWVLKSELRRHIRAISSTPEAIARWAQTGRLDV